MKRTASISRIALLAALVVGLVAVPAALAAKGGGGGTSATGATLSFDPGTAVVGQPYRVNGSGFRPNTWVTVGAHFADTIWWKSSVSATCSGAGGGDCWYSSQPLSMRLSSVRLPNRLMGVAGGV